MKSKHSTAFVISRLQLRVAEDDCALSIIRADAASSRTYTKDSKSTWK